MIEEIKGDETIRTTDGKLYKIVSASKEDFLCLEMRKDATRLVLLSDLDLAKHSSNLIDLIEVRRHIRNTNRVI